MRSKKSKGHLAVKVALAANVLIALTKFAAAFIGGSSAMAAEGIHSTVDSIENGLLMYGQQRARRLPDAEHPFGYGRELYFWSFVVAMMVFALGTGAAVIEGIWHLLHPERIEKHYISWIVLGASALFEGGSWLFTLRTFRREKGEQGWFEAVRTSKDPSTFTVLFEDSAAMVGLAIAAIGIGGSQLFDMPRIDAAASICIGLVLACSALLLGRETKQLLIGEPAHPHIQDSILRLAGARDEVRTANGVVTTQFGPAQVVAALSAEFEDGLTTECIEHCVDHIEREIRDEHPEVAVLFVKPQTHETWRRRRRQLERNSQENAR